MLGGAGSDCAGAVSFRVAGAGVAGQAGAGRAHSRCQQARNASFQGQVRLNAVMRLDPSLAGPDGWTIGLLDPVAGGQVYFETRVAVDKA